jgi:hypothetical protein
MSWEQAAAISKGGIGHKRGGKPETSTQEDDIVRDLLSSKEFG